MVLRVLKLLMRPLFGVPTPLANVAFVVAVYFRWQDLSQIAGLATLTLLGRDGAQCKLCDTVLLFAMKEVKVNKLKGGIDCRTVCFGLGGRCEDTCKTVKAALSNSTSAPCQAAGFCPHQTGEEECRWSYKAMGCLPAGGVCRHRLPTIRKASHLSERPWATLSRTAVLLIPLRLKLLREQISRSFVSARVSRGEPGRMLHLLPRRRRLLPLRHL